MTGTLRLFDAITARGVPCTIMRQRALTRAGLLASVLVVLIGGGQAAATGQFAPSFYPPATPTIGAGAAFTSCPNPAGLQRFTPAATALTKQVALSYGHVSLATDLRHTDRSWWSHLQHNWQRLAYPVVRSVQLGGPKMLWSGVVRHYCGPKLVTDSLNVFVGGRKLLNCDCNGINLLFIDRRGRPLVYMIH